MEQDGRLQLRGPAFPRVGAVCADWHSPEQHRRVAAGRRQPLVRACGLHRRRDLQILDATAGFGRDAWVLAAAGAQVTLCERQPVMAALLRDAMRRALAEPADAAIAAHIELIEGDALQLLAGPRHWDVIYLDPMYPEDGKTALPAKSMQLLRDLAGADVDADQLLVAALARTSRVAVKRPISAPALAGAPPTQSLRATQVRYDLYLNGNAATESGTAGQRNARPG